MKIRAAICLTVCTAMLPSCVHKVDTRITNSGAQNATAENYIWVMPERVTSQTLEKAQKLVAERLKAKGYRAAADGKLYLQVGISSRPASLSLKQTDGVLAQAKAKSSSSKCQSNEYRLSITLNRVSDGSEVYRSSAGEYHCKLSIDEVLPVLVDAVLADIGSPRGSYVLERKIPRPKKSGLFGIF